MVETVRAWTNDHIAHANGVGVARFYHVTPTVLLPSIDLRGVDPIFANGALKVSWWCDKTGLLWALSHISTMKSISVDQLSVVCGAFWVGAMGKTKAPSVYTCRFVTFGDKIYNASMVLTWFRQDGSFANG